MSVDVCVQQLQLAFAAEPLNTSPHCRLTMMTMHSSSTCITAIPMHCGVNRARTGKGQSAPGKFCDPQTNLFSPGCVVVVPVSSFASGLEEEMCKLNLTKVNASLKQQKSIKLNKCIQSVRNEPVVGRSLARCRVSLAAMTNQLVVFCPFASCASAGPSASQSHIAVLLLRCPSSPHAAINHDATACNF